MLEKSEMMQKPAAVTVEKLPDGGNFVTLRSNIVEAERTDTEGAGTCKVWTFDEVQFMLPVDRHETASSIKNSFDDWWQYGLSYSPEVNPITLEDRIANLESAMLAMLNL